MKHRLTFVLLALTAAAVVASARWAGQGGAAPNASMESALTNPTGKRVASLTDPSARSSTSDDPGNKQSGQAMLAQAAQEVASLPRIKVRLRVESRLLGRELIGTGNYCQFRRNKELKLRLELKLPVGGQVSSLLEVSDSRFLWARRDLPREKTLSRIDQRQVRQALEARHSNGKEIEGTSWMALGGLARLIEGLATHFEFGTPLAETRGNTPVWMIEGKWKPESLKTLVPGKIDTEHWPEHLPQRVVVVLCRDWSLPLFPLNIEYLRQGRAGGAEKIASLELFEIDTDFELDPKLFSYNPGDQEVFDRTEECLARLGLK